MSNTMNKYVTYKKLNKAYIAWVEGQNSANTFIKNGAMTGIVKLIQIIMILLEGIIQL